MQTVDTPSDDASHRRPARWVAPALLLAIVGALAPLWWEVTAPPILAAIQPWRDAAGTLMVPAAAVRPPSPLSQVEAAASATLFVVKDGVARRTVVQLGALRDSAVEVRAGLEDAALVVANPPRGLEDMHRVAVRK